MKNINQYATKCMEMLDQLGICYGDIASFEVNRRAKSRWGQTKRIPGGRYSININERLLRDDAPDRGLEETLLHELVHTCDGCMNHGWKWKSLIAKVNRAYGYNIKRADSEDDKGLEHEKVERVYRYQFVCEGCGQTIRRQRSSDFVKRYRSYTCGVCHGRFKQIV